MSRETKADLLKRLAELEDELSTLDTECDELKDEVVQLEREVEGLEDSGQPSVEFPILELSEDHVRMLHSIASGRIFGSVLTGYDMRILKEAVGRVLEAIEDNKNNEAIEVTTT